MRKNIAVFVVIVSMLVMATTPTWAQPTPMGAVNGRIMWDTGGAILPLQDAVISLSRINQDGVRVHEGFATTNYDGYFLLDQPSAIVNLDQYDNLVIYRYGFDDHWEEVSLQNGYNFLSEIFLTRKKLDVTVTASLEGNRLRWTGSVYANAYTVNSERWVVNTELGGVTFKNSNPRSTVASIVSVEPGFPSKRFSHTVELPPGPSDSWVWGQVTAVLPSTGVFTDASTSAFFMVRRSRPGQPIFFASRQAVDAFLEDVRKGQDPTAPKQCAITGVIAKPEKPTNSGFFTDPDEFTKLRATIRPQTQKP